jgi:hypothetical protein
MNYRMLAAAAAISLSAFGAASCSEDPPAGPTGPPTTFVHTFGLTTAAEVPPLANATEASASGTVTITLNVTRDAAGTITAATTTFVCNVTGFPAGSAVNVAHIHAAAAGASAGVFLNTGLVAGEVTLTGGAGSFTKTAVNTTVAQAEAIIANPAGHYFNVHSTLNPSGVLRGQLILTSSSAQ